MDLIKDSVWGSSRELVEFLAAHNWEPYDLGAVEAYVPVSWEQINSMEPAAEFIIGHNYFLLPKLKNGQIPKEAYQEHNCLGPALRIENANEPFWLAIQLRCLRDTALLSRLHFWEKALVAFSVPPSGSLLDNDVVMIDYSRALEVFENHFFIITQDELKARMANADEKKEESRSG